MYVYYILYQYINFICDVVSLFISNALWSIIDSRNHRRERKARALPEVAEIVFGPPLAVVGPVEGPGHRPLQVILGLQLVVLREDIN